MHPLAANPSDPDGAYLDLHPDREGYERQPRTDQDDKRAPGHLARTMRGLVHGTSLYVVPRADGELVIGATSEEMGFDTSVTAGTCVRPNVPAL